MQNMGSILQKHQFKKKCKNKLVVVEFAASDTYKSNKIYPFLVVLSRTCNNVEFLLVMGDESDKTKELCRREKIEKFWHFSFYKAWRILTKRKGSTQIMV